MMRKKLIIITGILVSLCIGYLIYSGYKIFVIEKEEPEIEEAIPPLNYHPEFPIFKKLENGTIIEVYES